MKVFIGCSTNYADNNKKICTDLNLQKIVNFLRKDRRYEVLPWWEDNTIPQGASHLESLIELSKNCDYGLFIFGPDDILSQEGATTNRLGVIRDNVLLECGMFLAVNGIKRTCILIDNTRPGDMTKIPSDLLAHKYGSLEDENIEQSVNGFFTRANQTKPNRPDIFFNKNISSAIVKEQYKTWGTKALFVGAKSAIKWIEIEKTNYHDSNVEGSHLITAFMKADEVKIITKTVNNVISWMGPKFVDTLNN
jgi:hypothetical protein